LRKQRNIVKSSIEWCAVGNDAMIHLIHARVQTGAPRAAWSTLAVVLGEAHALLREPIKIWRSNEWMTRNG
jgi:hypothetical protein